MHMYCVLHITTFCHFKSGHLFPISGGHHHNEVGVQGKRSTEMW